MPYFSGDIFETSIIGDLTDNTFLEKTLNQKHPCDVRATLTATLNVWRETLVPTQGHRRNENRRGIQRLERS